MNARDAVIHEAIEVFVRGYCIGRSWTYPHLASRVEDLWCLRDAERKNPADYRKEEWIAFESSAADVDRIARKHTRGRFFVCAATGQLDSDDQLRDDYKRLGYRLLTTEPFFVHSLKRIPRVSVATSTAEAVSILQVNSLELAERFAKLSKSRPMTAEQIADGAALRQYVAEFDGELVASVRSVHVGQSTWVANMKVEETYRRRGIGILLLDRMLRDDRKLGFSQSVLLATQIGAKLYPKLGFKQIGLMYIFAPPR